MTPLYFRQDFGHLPKLHVYVDETGDRGFSDKSRAKSPFFAMTALLVPAEEEWTVKYTAGGLRALVHSGPPEARLKPLHWVEHFKAKRPERRLHAAKVLAQMPDAKVIHVITHKDSLGHDSVMRRSKEHFYNYTARLLLERVARAAQGWPGGKRLAIVRLGAVKHMDHSTSESHLDHVRNGGCETYSVPWALIKWPPTWETTQRDGIQLADIHAGLLNAALSGDPADRDCASNLLLCRHQLRRSRDGRVLGHGVKVIGDETFVTGRAWWPDWARP
ncbi:DUF3800 domain-containing protein [Streptomyces sp. 891-h]|uniref:DUF3800 domain-containing protein n=1 Tax=Streptomyces sp. 891-h TaxID=2720714 RepID=UPI001FA97B89|nr:DUF3800 domain-containing protein [Streptomyces sp. 891-h]UNZ20598.1 DUF3800 domain-containing protein [Streptomyces sp. 891-h]